MEEKQLNFNRPILSVRRYSSTVASHKDEKRNTKTSLPTLPSILSYKPELKSGPVSNPGSVPFVWERSPGRPKDETTAQANTKERPPGIPKLPPGRVLKPKKQDLDIISEETNVTKESKRNPLGMDSVLLAEKRATTLESSKERKEDSSDSGNDDDDDEEAYMDALDTLSRSESFFYNCSVSGVSGLDSDIEPSIFSTDPKTRDFMMGRFLPAAKALASEVPQHTSWKQPVVKEKPPEVKKVVNKDKPQLRYGPNFLQDYAHGNEEEEGDSDYDYDERKNISNACGLLPRFCLKGSFGLMNPVPALSMRTRLPTPPASRTRASSSSASSFSETENEPARIGIYEHRSLGGSPSAKHHEEKSVVKSTPTDIANPKNSQKLEGSALYNRLQSRGTTSPTQLSQSPVRLQNDSSLQKKNLLSFKELLADENDRERDAQSPMVEKTLYVDTVHKIESPKSSLDTKGQSKLRENDIGILKDLQIASEPIESCLFADILKQDKEMETRMVFREDSKVDHDSYASANAKVLDNINGDQSMKVSRRFLAEHPAPPPLPKSPSDSWLWRTLPSLSSKSSSLRSNSKYPASKPSSNDPNWVKSIQLRHSQGLLLPIPET